MSEEKISYEEFVLQKYSELVRTTYKDADDYWPVISGHNLKVGTFQDWVILVLKHTGNSALLQTQGLGELSSALIGQPSITKENISSVRERLALHYKTSSSDAIFIGTKNLSNINEELNIMFESHKAALGLSPMKIFLSHKGTDKPQVRRFKETLAALGFEPWLDEDAMAAGVELERGLLKGFNESCAAVFFITPNYVDEKYLATEVNYAIAEKRKKGVKFSIITLVLEIDSKKGEVPDLLKPYVWKEPRTELEALQEMLKSVPLKVGKVQWK